MLKLYIVEGHNKLRIASVSRRGIRYRGKLYVPTDLRRLDAGAADASGAAAGALAGGMAFGAAGLIAGSIIGRGSRTTFVIETRENVDLVGTVRSDEFAVLYVEVEKLKRLPAIAHQSPDHLPGLGRRLLFGPFYFVRFGFGWLAAAIFMTVMTYGLAWIALPFLAGKLDRRKVQRASPPTLPPGSPAEAG